MVEPPVNDSAQGDLPLHIPMGSRLTFKVTTRNKTWHRFNVKNVAAWNLTDDEIGFAVNEVRERALDPAGWSARAKTKKWPSGMGRNEMIKRCRHLSVIECEHHFVTIGVGIRTSGEDWLVAYIPNSATTLIMEDFATSSARHLKRGAFTLWLNMSQYYANISFRDVESYFEKSYPHQLHRLNAKLTTVVPMIASGAHSWFQLDTIYLPDCGALGYVFLMIDILSKYMWAFPSAKIDSEHAWRMAGPVLERELAIFEKVNEKNQHHFIVHTDNGSEFKGHFLAGVNAMIARNPRVKFNHGLPYHPWSQGVVERLGKTFKGLLFMNMTQTTSKTWPKMVEDVVYNINNSIHSATAYRPEYVHKLTETNNYDATQVTVKIRKRMQERAAKIGKNDRWQIDAEKMAKRGDLVRIPLLDEQHQGEKNARKHNKSHLSNWSVHIYVVTDIRIDTRTHGPVYILRSMLEDGSVDNTQTHVTTGFRILVAVKAREGVTTQELFREYKAREAHLFQIGKMGNKPKDLVVEEVSEQIGKAVVGTEKGGHHKLPDPALQRNALVNQITTPQPTSDGIPVALDPYLEGLRKQRKNGEFMEEEGVKTIMDILFMRLACLGSLEGRKLQIWPYTNKDTTLKYDIAVSRYPIPDNALAAAFRPGLASINADAHVGIIHVGGDHYQGIMMFKGLVYLTDSNASSIPDDRIDGIKQQMGVRDASVTAKELQNGAIRRGAGANACGILAPFMIYEEVQAIMEIEMRRGDRLAMDARNVTALRVQAMDHLIYRFMRQNKAEVSDIIEKPKGFARQMGLLSQLKRGVNFTPYKDGEIAEHQFPRN